MVYSVERTCAIGDAFASPPHAPAPTRPRSAPAPPSALGPACELSPKTSALCALRSALCALRSACSRGEALALRAGPPVLGLAVIEQLHHLGDKRQIWDEIWDEIWDGIAGRKGSG